MNNNGIKKYALTYQRIEQLLRGAKAPMTRAEIYATASVREVIIHEHTVGDVLESFRSRHLVRRIPAAGHARAKYVYEWIAENAPSELVSKVPTEAENNIPVGIKLQKVEAPVSDKPEITVTANGVTILTSKIKITVEL